jgi:hypothetical protein
MPPLVAIRSPSRRPLPRLRRLLTIAALASVHALRSTAAQAPATLSHTDDAIPIPGGWVRLSVGNVWERHDSRFGESATIGLGDPLSTDSLGPRQLPRISPIEGGLKTLTQNPAQRLTFGRLEVRSDARVVTTPIALEYGITRRLSFGVVVPIVQTRTSAQVLVNRRGAGDTTKTSNAGVWQESQRAAMALENKKVVDSLTKAASSLTGLLARCAQNPLATECNTIRGKEADAAAAASRATEFAGAVSVAYGVNAQSAVVAPLAGSALAKAVQSQLTALSAQLASYIPGTVLGTLPTVTTEFSYVDLQGRSGTEGLLQSTLGGGLDSIATTERIGVGDIELRARVLLLERVQRDSLPPRSFQYRLGLGGIVRFATSRPDSALDLIDIGTGEGAGIEVRSALDVSKGRVGATIAGRYATYFERTVSVPLVGYPIAGFPYPEFGEVSRTAGNVLGIDVTPRFFVGDWLAFEGLYGYEHTDAPKFSGAEPSPCSACVALPNSILPTPWTVQRLGVGVRYSTVDSFLRGRARYPVEVSYRHLETITGDAGAPKQFRDQIQLRIYYRIRG